MKKLLFIVNANAGTRRINRELCQVIELFNRGGYEVSVHITAGRLDATKVAQARAGAVDLVVCAGGDGTLNEVVNGILLSGEKTPIGYIPCGSTNDFANSLHIPTQIKKAAQMILEKTPVCYDVGKFQQRYFTYVASFGAFTKASYKTPQNVKNALGHTAYILEGIQEISQLKPIHVKLKLDEKVVEDNFLFGAVSNSTSVGGILTLDPKKVDMTDGKFEVLLVRAPKDLLELNECIWALQKQTYNCAMMTFQSASRVEVEADPHMAWSLDGERAEGGERLVIENLHHAISIVTKG